MIERVGYRKNKTPVSTYSNFPELFQRCSVAWFHLSQCTDGSSSTPCGAHTPWNARRTSGCTRGARWTSTDAAWRDVGREWCVTVSLTTQVRALCIMIKIYIYARYCFCANVITCIWDSSCCIPLRICFCLDFKIRLSNCCLISLLLHKYPQMR